MAQMGVARLSQRHVIEKPEGILIYLDAVIDVIFRAKKDRDHDQDDMSHIESLESKARYLFSLINTHKGRREAKHRSRCTRSFQIIPQGDKHLHLPSTSHDHRR